MTAPVKKRAGRTGYTTGRRPGLIEWLNYLSTVCGYCAGQRSVWCPDCGGFAGCDTCGHTFKVPCQSCAGGDLEKWVP